MPERRVPSRVMLLDAESRRAAGLSETKWQNTWCFCGADASLDELRMNHCHLFDMAALQQLAVGEKCRQQHMSVHEKLNGKTRSNLVLDGSGSCDSVQLATVTCSYGIPSSVECLDLAVSCLQRISGNYFINRKLPCVVSVCQCNVSSKNTVDKSRTAVPVARSRKSCPRKRLTAMSELEPCVHPARDNNRSSSRSNSLETECEQRRRRQSSSHCTRSSSRQLVDSSYEAATGDCDAPVVTQSVADRKVSVSSFSEHSLESPSHCDNLTLLNSHMMLERKTRSAAAVDRDKTVRCLSDSLTEMPLKTVTADARKSLTKYRQRLQKVIVKKRALRSAVHSTRKLRSHRSLSLLQAENRQLKSTQVSSSSSVRTRRHGSAQTTGRSGITADCEVLVSRLAVHGSAARQTRTRKNGRVRRQRACAVPVLPVSVNDAAVPSRLRSRETITPAAAAECTVVSSAGDLHASLCNVKSPNIKNFASEPDRESDEVSKLSALSVDIGVDYTDDCTSPASPLPVLKSQHCNTVLQTAALILSRRLFFLCFNNSCRNIYCA